MKPVSTLTTLNAEFDRRAAVHASQAPWVPSPAAGVERKMLDRVGGEVARATSLVRYAPGSHFAAHVHGGGEEFLVLEGVFQDERGDYPAGTYVRNPPTSSHTPGSEPGCTILVKLWQFDATDREQVVIDTTRGAYASVAGRTGVERLPLYQGYGETVAVERWDADTHSRLQAAGGIELLVLEGTLEIDGESFARHDWLRLAAGTALDARAGSAGCRFWVKSGHLAGVTAEAVRLRLAAQAGR